MSLSLVMSDVPPGSQAGPDRTGLPLGPVQPVHAESVQNTGPDRSGPDRSMQSLFKTPVRTGLAGPCRNDSKPSTWQQQCNTVTRFSMRQLILLDPLTSISLF